MILWPARARSARSWPSGGCERRSENTLRLTGRDTRAVLQFVRRLYAARDLDGFAHHLVGDIRMVVGAQHVGYNDVDLRRARNIGFTEPQVLDAGLVDAFNRNLGQHPLIAHYARSGDGRVRTISDFLTTRAFHRLALYHEFYRRLDVEFQIAISFPTRPSHILGLALTRHRRDFSQRDRRILDVLRPHIIQAYANAERVARVGQYWSLLVEGLEAQGSAVVQLTAKRPAERLSRAAHGHLADYLGASSGWRGALPEMLRRWIAQHASALKRRDDVPAPRQPLVLQREGGSLTIRFLGGGDQAMLLLTEQHLPPTPAELTRLGLTRRESEVLGWVAQGKTNPEIARILGNRPKTVSKHLERIYQRLGVETRTAAVARALTAPHAGADALDKTFGYGKLDRTSKV